MLACTQEPGSPHVPRPKTGQTPIRHIRIGDEIWEQVEWVAEQDDTNATSVVKTALAEYIAKRRRQARAQAKGDA
jgi:predicted transcriptional regulator